MLDVTVFFAFKPPAFKYLENLLFDLWLNHSGSKEKENQQSKKIKIR